MRERHKVSGFTTIEMVIVLSLFGFVLVSLVGLHLVAISTGTAAETSSIAGTSPEPGWKRCLRSLVDAA